MDIPLAERWSEASAEDAAPEPFDPQRFIALLKRRRRTIFTIFTAALAIAIAAVCLIPPRYTAVALVMLDPRQEKVVDAQQVLSALPMDPSTVDSQVEVLKSPALAQEVVAALHLDRDPEFAPPTRSGPFTGAPVPAVERVRRRLTIKRQGLTAVIGIGFTSTSPQKAASIANAVADRYLHDQREAKADAANRASGWLNTRLDGLRSQVEAAETAVQAYQAVHGLMIAGDNGATITQQEISGLNTQYAAARAEQAEAEAKLGAARTQIVRGSDGEALGEALSSNTISQLRQQRATVSGQVAELSGRYGARHPEMLKAQRRLADIDAQIQAELRRFSANLEAQATVARRRTASISASLSASKGALATANAASVTLNELKRKADSLRSLYQSLLDRYRQTTAQQGTERPDARLVAHASVPTTAGFPKVPLTLLLALLIGSGLAVLAVLVLEALDTRLYTGADVERRLGASYIGAIPDLASATPPRAKPPSPTRTVIDQPFSAFSESFRGVRTAVFSPRVRARVRTLAVTSALPAEGKTVTCIALGRIIALGGGTVVVVDCDLRRRSVNRLFAEEPKLGLLEVLSGAASLDQALIRDAVSGAMFLPLTASHVTPRDVFASSAMDSVLEALRQRFEVVLLDTAPVLPLADTLVLAPKTDATLLLARWKSTPRKAVDLALGQLDAAGAQVIGVALTQVDMREQTRSGYGDKGYYAKAYRPYYVDGPSLAGPQGRLKRERS